MNAQSRNKQNTVRNAVFSTMSFIIVLVLNGPVLAQTSARAAKELSSAFSAASKRAMPAVVSIKVEKSVEVGPMAFGTPFGYNDPFGLFDDELLKKFFGDRLPPQQQQQQQAPRKYYEHGQGSGFIISEDGYILTNNHVVGDVDKITVELKDGRKFENAKLIGTDPDSEVALIKIDGTNFPVLPMGNSDRIEIGDWVIAIGNPFGLSETVTVGVISAVGRSNVHIAAYEDFIQTDAAINPGNSGGPLINLDGQVIGINTAIFSQSGGYMGIGFAIPINMARNIEQQLKENGKVTRGYLGIYGQDMTTDMAELLNLRNSEGVIVAQVEKGSPAEKAGIKNHDVLLKMNGRKIESYESLRNEIAMLSPGSRIVFQVLSDGNTSEIAVKLAERPMTMAQGNMPKGRQKSQEALGIEVQDLTKDLAERFGYALGQGVIVTRVIQGSPAAEAGIQPGDLIQSVNQKSVSSADDFEKAVMHTKGNKVLLLIKRGEYSQFVVVRFGE
jgi:serine protease Do